MKLPVVLAAVFCAAFAPVPVPDAAKLVGKTLPNVSFEDDSGRKRELRSLGGQPLVVLPVYVSCHATCTRIAMGLKQAVLDAELDLRSYQVLVFSFDPNDSVEDLREFRRMQKLPASWVLGRFEPESIRTVLDALDYRAFRDGSEWAHPNAVAFVSPEQTVAKFLYGVSFTSEDVSGAIAVAQAAVDWQGRAAPWALAFGMMGLTLSTVTVVHLLGRRRERGPRG
jgi:cytochrome oxidase Cu insertion factor (SCO1/SenC/PrrC family)